MQGVGGENSFNKGEGDKDGDSSGEDDSDDEENGVNSEVGNNSVYGWSPLHWLVVKNVLIQVFASEMLLYFFLAVLLSQDVIFDKIIFKF